MRSTLGIAASRGLNGLASHPTYPHTIVVRVLPPPSSRAVVSPCAFTLSANGNWAGLGAK